MKSILLSAMVLLVCSLSVAAATQVKLKHGSHADAGVINKEAILYWLQKRGELSANATEEQQKSAVDNYLANKSFKPKNLSGHIGRQVMLEQKKYLRGDAFSATKTSRKSSRSARVMGNAEEVTETKVLAIMVDFSDLKHNKNSNFYSQAHYTDLLFSNLGNEGEIKSVYQYYQQESGGTLNFTGSANGWVTAANNAAFYGGNNQYGDDQAVEALVMEAVTKAVAELGVDLAEYDQSDFSDLDGDGNIYESDGVVDHVMIFHASIGEEAGGGELGENAIWSHRFFLSNDFGSIVPVSVPGSPIKIFGYTINPIDSKVGVVAHEFGHDLGVPDEYDTGNGQFSSPVSDWSIMASGSWVDNGEHPSGFSPFAKEYFQLRYGGNWINQQVLELDQLTTESLDLVAATNHQAGFINQVKVNLPISDITFAPYSGLSQFYSNQGHGLNNSITFSVNLPAGVSSLSMKAHWDIEQDFDYVQVLVNGTAIEGNLTQFNNPEHGAVRHFISGKSVNNESAEGNLGWLALTYDLSSFAGQNVDIKISYITDTSVGGYGFVVDDFVINNAGNEIFSHGAERDTDVVLDNFVRTEAWSISGQGHNYYIQLRDHTATDAFLKTDGYDAGILVWYRNQEVADNNVNEHSGQVFIGVVDADQSALFKFGSLQNTPSQIRDAAFSLYDQSSSSDDEQLSANSKFDDKLDYSTPRQPESGIILPTLGLTMEVTNQTTDSSNASIVLQRSNEPLIKTQHTGLLVKFWLEDNNQLAPSELVWQFGDNTSATGNIIEHTFAQAGEFDVSVSYQTTLGEKESSYPVVVGEALNADIYLESIGLESVYTPYFTGGVGVLSYRWDLGDGSGIVTTKIARHTYADLADYDITLRVVDETHQVYYFTEIMTVDDALQVNFTGTDTNLTLRLTSTVSGGEQGYSYLWDFGDNTTSIEENPTHTYNNAGTYQVSLTVTDNSGTLITRSRSYTVSAAPVVNQPNTTARKSSGGSFGYVFFILVCMSVMRRVKKLS